MSSLLIMTGPPELKIVLKSTPINSHSEMHPLHQHVFESVVTPSFHNVQQKPPPQCLVWKTSSFAFNLCLIISLVLVFWEIMNDHSLFSFSELIKTWNSMPQDLVKSECLYGFKGRLDKVIEDNYICRTHPQIKKPWATIIAGSGSSEKNITYTNPDLIFITGHLFLVCFKDRILF